MNKTYTKPIRYSLGIILIILAINAFGGGFYGMAGAEDVPTEWLNGSPFQNYFIPSLFLFLLVGGSALIAAITVLKGLRIARTASLICGVIVLVWLIIQIAVIGYVSWMQPATAIVGLLIVFLGALLPKNE